MKYFLFGLTRIVAMFLLASCSTSVQGQLSGDPALFVEVADTWRANFESIETWQGEVSIETQFLGAKAIKDHGDSMLMTARFWYSRDEGALKRIVDTHLGKTINGRDDVRRQTILRLPDALHAIRMTYPAREPDQSRIATVKISVPEEDRLAFTTEDFDPLIWLRCETSSDVDDRMRQIHDNLKEFQKLWAENPGVDQKSLSKKESLVIYTSLFGKEAGRFRKNAFTFDLSKGGLPVDAIWTSSEPNSGTQLEVRPCQIAGTWVPESATYHYRENPETERIINVLWTKNLVNEPLPEQVFDPATLGLVVGDPVVDMRSGKEERHGVQPTSDTSKRKAGRLNFGTILVVGLSLVMLILIVRRTRRDG